MSLTAPTEMLLDGEDLPMADVIDPDGYLSRFAGSSGPISGSISDDDGVMSGGLMHPDAIGDEDGDEDEDEGGGGGGGGGEGEGEGEGDFLVLPRLPTGCCYDDRMKLHVNADLSAASHHPEDPRRIEEIWYAFRRAGLVYTGSQVDLPKVLASTPTKYMWRIPAREAIKEEICECHLSSHWDWVMNLGEMSIAELREMSRALDQGRQSLYVGSMSYLAALLSAGGAIDTCKAVVEGHVKNAFAVIRPPGHHAEYDQAMGFCFFNNVPVAVRVCQREYPDTCRKVLILDWDVHHGNGTQNIFYDDPNVLYISLHVWQDGKFYPGKSDNEQAPHGGVECVGTGKGTGLNVNIPWDSQGMGDAEYIAAFQKIVMPIAQEFDPDLVIISAGFDAAAGDELGGCFVTPTCYAHMTHMLMRLANGKVAVCLEGGYNLEAISSSAVAVAKTLMGFPIPRLDLGPISKDADRTLFMVQATHAPYWECMRNGIVDVGEVQEMGGMRMDDIMRQAQRQALQDKYHMVPLYIQKQSLFRCFENQVLVTPDMARKRQVLVIYHDPPQVLGTPDPTSRDGLKNKMHPHDVWMVDAVPDYIDWAVGKDFGIIDIHIPLYNPKENNVDLNPVVDNTPVIEWERQVTDLICYLWDNYLQMYDESVDIFLLGIGQAYIGNRCLLLHRECKSRVRGVISFTDSSLRGLKSDTDPDLSAWYYDNSRIYTPYNHLSHTDPKYAKRLKGRKHGFVLQSPVLGINKMMKTHAEEVYAWIMERTESPSGDTTDEDIAV